IHLLLHDGDLLGGCCHYRWISGKLPDVPEWCSGSHYCPKYYLHHGPFSVGDPVYSLSRGDLFDIAMLFVALFANLVDPEIVVQGY
uniref:hypothetical protein n=1 Tax=Brevibacillus thermoruber TaxID=33942 RepID=UPI001E29F0F7